MSPAWTLQRILALPFMPAVFFFAGVTYDTITLSRIDRVLDNLIIFGYLTLLGGLIVLTGRLARKGSDASPTVRFGPMTRFVDRTRPFFPNAIQFLLGGLFSAYTIFYFQSASWTTTAVFFFVLIGLLVANEFLRDRLTSLRLLISLYTMVWFSFFSFFLPVLIGFMHTMIFLLGAFLSLAMALWVVELIYKVGPRASMQEKILVGLPAGGLILLLVSFYFLNWIPPVPLSLKFGGIYHEVTKTGERYDMKFEKSAWYQFWKRSDDPFHGDGPVYCFTAVFAPVDLQTTIVHHWEYRAAGETSSTSFRTSDTIPIKISGGREGGYRAYSVKKRVVPGEWRVTAETQEGKVIGRVEFYVEPKGDSPLEFETHRY